MSFLDDLNVAIEASKHLGNMYSVTLYVAQIARKFSEKYEGVPLHSEALTYALQGEIPECIKNLNSVHNGKDGLILYIQQILSDIDDMEVRNSVESSIFQSLKSGNLIYQYRSIKDPNLQARVRIIVNMACKDILTMHGGKIYGRQTK